MPSKKNSIPGTEKRKKKKKKKKKRKMLGIKNK